MTLLLLLIIAVLVWLTPRLPPTVMDKGIKAYHSPDIKRAVMYPRAIRILSASEDPSCKEAVQGLSSALESATNTRNKLSNVGNDLQVLRAALDNKDAPRALEMFRNLFEKGGRCSYAMLDRGVALFQQTGSTDGLQVLASEKNPLPSARALVAYMNQLLDENRINDSWAVFRRLQDDKNMLGQVTFFTRLIQAYANSGNANWAETVLRTFEERIPLARYWRAPFPSILYNSILSGNVRFGDVQRSLSLYERMIQPTNPTQITPILGTYHFLMLTAAFGWNVPAVEEIYSLLRQQSLELAKNLVLAPADGLDRWNAYQETLKKKYEGASSASSSKTSDATYPVNGCQALVLPAHIHLDRATENILMLAYSINNQPDKALQSLRDSFDLYPETMVGPVNEKTFEMVAVALLRKHDHADFHDRRSYVPLGKNIAQEWAGSNGAVTKDNVNSMLEMADMTTRKFLQNQSSSS